MPAGTRVSQVETTDKTARVDRIHNPRTSLDLDLQRVDGLAGDLHAWGNVAEFNRYTDGSNGCTGSKKPRKTACHRVPTRLNVLELWPIARLSISPLVSKQTANSKPEQQG